jgi:hypothetical protein
MSLMSTNFVQSQAPDVYERAKGAAGRLFVEDGNSAFYEGRQYFTFRDFSIAQAAVGVFRVVITEDVIMRDFFVLLTVSDVTVEIVTGGTAGGTFDSTLTIQSTNNMLRTPVRASTTTMTYGGTHTGGTVLDKFILSSGNNLNHAVGSQGGEQFPVGFPPGTYYVRITNTGNTTATGLFKARWTEDPN